MKKQFFLLSFLMGTCLVQARLPISSIITFFVHELPFVLPIEAEKFNQKVTTPGKIAQKIATSVVSATNRGIFATYGGYLVASDINGQITFPRMQQSTDFIFIVTEKIKPILMIGNTIHHWELYPTSASQVYTVSRHQDEQTKLWYWNVQNGAKLDNNIIPLNSIVLFAKPKNIIVPLGITLTKDTAQLILPPVYSVKNGYDIVPALETLKVRQFFGPIRLENKKENGMYYSTQMITTQ